MMRGTAKGVALSRKIGDYIGAIVFGDDAKGEVSEDEIQDIAFKICAVIFGIIGLLQGFSYAGIGGAIVFLGIGVLLALFISGLGILLIRLMVYIVVLGVFLGIPALVISSLWNVGN